MLIEAEERSNIRRRPLDGLLARGGAHSDDEPDFDFETPIDRGCWFVCPTLTPLYYAPIYQELDEPHRRRYNQLTALSFSELIAFFETTFAASVLAALAKSRRNEPDRGLTDCLESFIAEERHHTEWWRRLNRLSDPELYRDADEAIIRPSGWAKLLLRQVTRRPQLFPMAFWVMLILEERSLEISRRCMRSGDHVIEPRYRAIYRAHLAHEVRHVQIDWHLIERYYAGRSAMLRRINARMLLTAVAHFFLPPTRAAVRVVGRLVEEHPELEPIAATMRRQLVDVGSEPAYHEMMYSRESTPIAFLLFDRFPELHSMRRVLLSYQPR
jgi:P-aminobenzoate N-oxygenase AurF